MNNKRKMKKKKEKNGPMRWGGVGVSRVGEEDDWKDNESLTKPWRGQESVCALVCSWVHDQGEGKKEILRVVFHLLNSRVLYVTSLEMCSKEQETVGHNSDRNGS
jgi:hypothetical protein